MNIKFKIGDKVRIKNYMIHGTYSHTNVDYVKQMDYYKGVLAEINRVTLNGNYKLKGNNFTWAEEWLKPFNKWEQILI